MAKRQKTAGYPAHWEADVVLRDGSTAHVRPIRPQDAQAIQRFHMSQSPDSIYLRFFTFKAKLSAKEIERFTHVDHRERVALVLTRAHQIIGVGRYDSFNDPRHSAEIAFNIADSFQGLGLGSILLEHLAAAARECGIERFTAEILPENSKMLSVFIEAGYEVTRTFDDGVIALEFPLASTEKSLEVMASREQRAEARSVDGILTPSSIAVIGASRTWGSIGYRVLENIIESGYSSPVYAVNPEALELGGWLTYGSVEEIGEPVDLAVIAVPESSLEEVLEQCGRKGVKSAIILSDPLADKYEESVSGDHSFARLTRTARAYGMRLVGPGSLGIISTDPSHPLNASVSPQKPREGVVAFFAQSSATGIMLYAEAYNQCVGMSSFFSAGHRADLSGNDVMQYLENDSRTRAVGLFLESIGNPRKFARIARRLSLVKPVVVAKSHVMGFRQPGQERFEHTQAPSAAFEAILRQSGVIRARNIEDLVRVLALLGTQPVPRGPKVAIVTNSAALARVVADSAQLSGLEVHHTVSDLDFSRGISRSIGQIEDRFTECLKDSDSAILALVPAQGLFTQEVIRSFEKVARDTGTTVIASLTGMMGQQASRDHIIDPGSNRQQSVDLSDEQTVLGAQDQSFQSGVLNCSSPANALRALSLVTQYGIWKDKEHGSFPETAAEDDAVISRTVAQALSRVHAGEVCELTPEEVGSVFAACGLSVLEASPFDTIAEAINLADQMGYPVALKPLDESLRHRLDLGAVVLNISSAESLRLAIAQSRSSVRRYVPQGQEARFEVQKMAEPGQPCLLRAVEDPLLGPVLAFALAGDSAQILEDWAYAVTPMTSKDIENFLRTPRASRKLVDDPRLPAADMRALEDLVARIATLKDHYPDIARIDINPVLVHEKSLTILEAKVWVANSTRRRDIARRALREV